MMRWKFWQSSDDPVYLDGADGNPVRTITRLAGALIGVYLAICLVLAWWWDFEPDAFAVRENAARAAEHANQSLVPGYTTTATFVRIGETLLDKRGGYLSNDIFPPGVWMDNIPEWEFGVLMLLRDTARVYRNDFFAFTKSEH